MSFNDNGWLPEVGKVVKTHRLGNGESMQIVKVGRNSHIPPGYYVVLDQDNYWKIVYAHLPDRASADRAIRGEIGPNLLASTTRRKPARSVYQPRSTYKRRRY